MNGGVKTSLLVSCLAFAGCTTATKEVKVQAIPDPSAVLSQGGDEIAVARGQMVLGNVGLALEGFRKAQRANPSDPAALAGIGDCYNVMGRFDLAQSSYEAALALAPHDRRLLLGLAGIFDREGKPVLAMAARAEAAIAPQATRQSSVATAAPTPGQKAVASARAPVAGPTARASAIAPKPAEKLVDVPRPSIGSVTVELPRARPANRVEAQSVTLRATEIRAEDPAPAVSAAVPVHIPEAAMPVRVAQAVEIPHASVGSVAIALPPARPAEQVVALTAELPAAEIEAPIAPVAVQTPAPAAPAAAEQAVAIPRPSLETAMLDVPTPQRVQHVEAHAAQLASAQIEADIPTEAEATVPTAPARPALPRKPVPSEQPAIAVALAPAPRLERLTSREVALVTTGKALWRSPTNIQTASGSSVRWVALASQPGRPNVQILNAARSQGLAASARTVLMDRGWRKIAVGDAPATLHKSVVLYPKGRAALGHRLAAQFGVSAQMAQRDNVVLVLGRDSVDRIGGRRRS